MVDFNKIAKKWQTNWESSKIFKVEEDTKKKKCYVLEMYPYPSGSGLHMGHARNYCVGDCYARYKRMQGFNVLYPMGYDSFGLPAENAAIKAKSHPKFFTEKAIDNFVKQQKALGLSYDWSRMLASHKSDYYIWDQWIFLKMLEKGLAYKKKSIVNWCPKCHTVLANEQVHNGRCWRHEDTTVDVKDLEQWFFKITKYADELLKDIEKLSGWSEDVKTMQKNWIGKSTGAQINFGIAGSKKVLSVFTTRSDTFFGITFLVYAPEHPDVMELVKGTSYEQKVKDFVKKVVQEDRFSRTAEDKEKDGLFIGKYAINPVTTEKIPIYIANFVLYEYGTGAIIAVPAHDQRDFEFAKKYNIPIKVVINPPDYDLNPDKMSRSYMGDGVMVNSAQFNGMNNREAIPEFISFFKKENCGKDTVHYKLRDWLISRQRFWGCPIPIIYCDKCGAQPVPEKDLPIKLPEDYTFIVSKGNPLEHCKDFINTKCPECGGDAKRETDTMDTFVDSSWYFLRYCDPKNVKLPFDSNKASYWMPIDMYIGGKEHATMHLIYFRFFTKFLRDLGLLKIDEPTLNLFNQGMLHKGGLVMSKSRGNVVTQEEISIKYGIDTARFFLLFVASPDKDMEWDDKGVEGSFRFLNKLSKLVYDKIIVNDIVQNQESKLHKTIKEVTLDIEVFKYNQALISIMELTNYLFVQDTVNKKVLENLLLLLTPFIPHLCEELWEKLGNKPFISLEKWPVYDEKKIDAKIEAQEKVIETTISDLRSVLDLIKLDKPNKITLIVSSDWKYGLFKKIKDQMINTRNIGEIIKAVMTAEHSKEISSYVQRIIKNPSMMPKVILDQKKELECLKNGKDLIQKAFNCDIEIIKAEDSREQKASQAIPSKPAVIVS
ncbi:MAG: leucine--tRNA ligase [Nanoarchaeota archaeon]